MWKLLRPDSLEVLRDERARRALRRYFEVLEGRRAPKALLCRSIKVEVDLAGDEKALWREHERAVAALREMELKSSKGFVQPVKPSLLDLKVELAKRMLRSCSLCERRCKVDRREKAGVCRVLKPRIASMFHHYGEEPELVPSYTVFFSGCNFHCQFCQNHDISQEITGIEVGAEALAERLRGIEARNINWVGGSPTPNLPFILEVLNSYGGAMPSVWNSNMYMSEPAMALLEGTQDLFLTDFKYGCDACASRLSRVKSYTSVVKRNHLLARAQAELIVRHLVLPGHVECCTARVASFVATELGRDTRFNLMFQYRPVYNAGRFPELRRPLTSDEMQAALQVVKEAGLTNLV